MNIFISILVALLVSLAVSGCQYLVTTYFQEKRTASVNDQIDEIWVELENMEHVKSSEIKQSVADMEISVNKLGNEFTNLYEFVNTGIKKMSTRASRASKADMAEALKADMMKAYSQSKEAQSNQDKQVDAFQNRNGRPRLIRG